MARDAPAEPWRPSAPGSLDTSLITDVLEQLLHGVTLGAMYAMVAAGLALMLGVARLINFANFVHFNMPHGADYLNPQLTIEQAWDVAAYVLSQPRPQRAGLAKDFPDLLNKPVDAPYGPYADGFSETNRSSAERRSDPACPPDPQPAWHRPT